MCTKLPHDDLDLVVRQLADSDIDEVLQIEQAAHSHPWSRRLFEDCLGGRQHCLLLCTDTAILGYVVFCSAAGDAELLNIAIAPSWQRRGIARVALVHLIEKLASFAETLYLEVRESNTGALALYQDLEFVEVGVRPSYYPSAKGKEDAIIMAYTFISE